MTYVTRHRERSLKEAKTKSEFRNTLHAPGTLTPLAARTDAPAAFS